MNNCTDRYTLTFERFEIRLFDSEIHLRPFNTPYTPHIRVGRVCADRSKHAERRMLVEWFTEQGLSGAMSNRVVLMLSCLDQFGQKQLSSFSMHQQLQELVSPAQMSLDNKGLQHLSVTVGDNMPLQDCLQSA